MKTTTIQRYSELSGDQWRRIAVSAKRHVRKLTGKSCEVGVGRKYRNGKPCGWQIALRIYLPTKRKRVAQSQRIPDHFHIRLRRTDGSYQLIRIRSDVESLRDYVPTKAKVRSGSGAAASGFLIKWNARNNQRCWGFANVGHLFDNTSRRSASVRVDASTKFQCRRIKTAPQRERADIALLQIVGTSDDRVGVKLLKSLSPKR